ncbi:hypothetical protein AAFF_G00228840 [Aldrovandia affinis]|uniref:LRRCT domain-containing protein n=1 Tax=Aldrovandia affinis TaxID=143900 RepID=A0AAD7WUG9_9TELE|nr:hypothetical protein AAFF_G00228840 [Aldrovandia affinis]
MMEVDTNARSFKNYLKWSFTLVELCVALLLSAGSTTEGSVVNCSALNYPGTPCLFPPDTIVLDLSHNNMEGIRWQDFSLLSGLRRLFLQFNRINSVDTQAFKGNPVLEYLDISHNCLPQISSLPFANLLALSYLDVSNNVDEVLRLGSSFGQLEHLQVLKLGNPHITSFRKESFQELGALKLKEFLLITGDFSEYESGSLKVLHDLERVTLELNMWKNLDKLMLMLEDSINSTDALTILNLDLLRVNLKSLDLTKNSLQEETLFPDCVKPFPVIQSLVIDYNKFAHLGFLSSVTLHMKDLVNFSASFNNIHLEPHPPLMWTRSLRRLNLRGNQLFDDVLPQLPESLEMLDLSFNQIKAITNMVPMKNLVELYLSGNHLKSIPELSLFTSINLLHVDQNDIEAVDTHVIRSSRLTELKFSHNPFHCDCDILYVSEFCQTTSMSIVDWPAEFRCKTPESLNGTELRHVSYSWAWCHSGVFAFIMLLCTGVAAAVGYIAVKRCKRLRYSSVSTW